MSKANHLTYLPKNSNYVVEPCSLGDCYAINFDFFGDAEFEPFTIPIKNTAQITELFKSSEQIWIKKTPGYKTKCKANLYNILYLLTSEYLHTYVPPSKTDIIQPAVKYIHQNYTTETITLKELSDMCDISETYLRRLFTRVYGISPIKYINNLRLARANELLKSGFYSVSDVSGMSGFQDESYFSREFKKAYGVSPSKISSSKKGSF